MSRSISVKVNFRTNDNFLCREHKLQYEYLENAAQTSGCSSYEVNNSRTARANAANKNKVQRADREKLQHSAQHMSWQGAAEGAAEGVAEGAHTTCYLVSER